MKLSSDKINEIQKWSEERVTVAMKKSRTVSQMSTMWERIQEWSKHIQNEEFESWGASEAIQLIRYVETVGKKEYTTWQSQHNTLALFQKTMWDKGYHGWVKEGERHKAAVTTLNRIQTDESKTEISKHRITKKQSGELKCYEIEKVAAKLFMAAKEARGTAYELLRCMQYATWCFANNSGMRISDILRLQWDQIEVGEGKIKQRIHYSKSDRRGRKRDELVIYNHFGYPADLKTAYKMCLRIRKGLSTKTNLMFPKSTNIRVAADAESITNGWKKAAETLKISIPVGARTPKIHFLNDSYQNGTPPREIHKNAAWGGKSTDIRRFYIKSPGGVVAKDDN